MLSPAEKYDLYASGQDWPLTIRAMGETSPTEASWTGYCQGWSQASMATEEPNPVTMVNENGIQIPFGSSDIKALLTYFYGDVVTDDYPDKNFTVERRGIGSACGSSVAVDPACYDTNPGAFHIALTNMIGVQKTGFVIDVDPTYERWNQPVYAYQSRSLETLPPRDNSDAAVASIKIIQTQVTWGMEIEPQWEALGPHDQVTKTQDYFYTLELDADSEILGGQWVIRMDDGHFLTMDDAYESLSVVDKNNDGTPDFDREQISEILYQYYQFPDFAWMQIGANLPDSFETVWSDYSLIATTLSSREDLYDYFGKLPEILDASLGIQ